MPTSRDDLTDYLLDELTPERRLEVEEFLERSPEARAELERLRSLAAAVRDLPRERVPRSLTFVRVPERGSTGILASLGATFRPLMGAAMVVAAVALLLWAASPVLTRHGEGWTLAFGTSHSVPAGEITERMREIVRDEVTASETRLRRAVERAPLAAPDDLPQRRELAALRRELAEMHADAMAGYQFLNAKHELLRRQLLEFDMAAVGEVAP